MSTNVFPTMTNDNNLTSKMVTRQRSSATDRRCSNNEAFPHVSVVLVLKLSHNNQNSRQLAVKHTTDRLTECN